MFLIINQIDLKDHISNFYLMTLFLDQLPEEVKKKLIEKAKKMPGNCDAVLQGLSLTMKESLK